MLYPVRSNTYTLLIIMVYVHDIVQVALFHKDKLTQELAQAIHTGTRHLVTKDKSLLAYIFQIS